MTAAHRRTLAILLVLLSPAWDAPGQTLEKPGLEPIQNLILRGDLEAAAALARQAREQTPPSRLRDPGPGLALLEAAAIGDSIQRAEALLSVASLWPDRDEGVAALLAAAKVLSEWRGDRSASDAVIADEPDDLLDGERLLLRPERRSAQFQLLRTLLAGQSKRLPEDPRLRRASELLARGEITSDPAGYQRVRPAAELPLPAPLAAPAHLRVLRLPDWPELEGQASAASLPEAAARRFDAGEGEAAIRLPSAGMYLVEMRSGDRPWRSIRRVLASDLDLTVHAFPGTLAVMASLGGLPAAGVAVTARCETDVREAVTDNRGIAVIQIPTGDSSRSCQVQAAATRNGAVHAARIAWCAVDGPGKPATAFHWHLMLDRPLYRPGDPVRGRIAIRTVQTGPDAPPEGRPASAARLRIQAAIRGTSVFEFDGTPDADGTLPFEFQLPADAAPGELRVALSRREDREGSESWSDLGGRYQAEVRNFARPPILFDLDCPESWSPGKSRPEIRIQATWPSGAPAAGAEGQASCSFGSFRHRVPLLLDAGGRATVALALDEWDFPEAGAQTVRVEATLVAADGQEVRKSARLRVEVPAGAEAPPDPAVRRIECPPSVDEGQMLPLKIRGEPGDLVFVSRSDHRYRASLSVQIGPSGAAEVPVPVDASSYPAIRFHASFRSALGESAGRERTCTAAVRRPRDRWSIAIAPPGNAVAPGESAGIRFAVRDGTGAPRRAFLSVAVVDESLLLLRNDATPDPVETFRPSALHPRARFAHSPAPVDPWQILATGFQGGLVPDILSARNLRGAGGGVGGRHGGGGASGAGGDAPLRKDFTPVAFWTPRAMTDADGVLSISFTMPDDVTTWRIIAAATGPGLEGGLASAGFRTELPVALTPVLPRQLREGDGARVRLVAAAGAGTSGDVLLTADATESIAIDPRQSTARLEAGAAIAIEHSLRAGAATGDGKIEFGARRPDGTGLDRILLPLAVASNAIEWTETATLVAGRDSILHAPSRTDATPIALRLDLLGSETLLMQQAARYLARYPSGGAATVSASLVPLALARRAHLRESIAEASDTPLHLFAALQAHRIESGLLLLRSLQGEDGGFGAWTRHQTHPGVTARVLQTLALLEDEGFQFRRYGIRAAGDLPILAEALSSLGDPPGDAPAAKFGHRILDRLFGDGSDEPFHTQAALKDVCELIVAGLRIDPGHDALLKACTGFVRLGERLPSGLLARAAIALHRAGDGDLPFLAAEILGRRHGRDSVSPRFCNSGESPAVRAAAHLELLARIAPGSPMAESLAAELLRRNRDGRLDHVLGTAQGLVALARFAEARDEPVAARAPFPVTVSSGGESRVVELDKENGYCASIPMPAVPPGPVEIRKDDGRLLVASLVAIFREDGIRAEARSAPLAVERRLNRLVPKGSGSFDRVPVRDSVCRGDLLELEVEVRGPADAAFLSVDCPLPAGFQVSSAGRSALVYDDRVSMGATSLDGDGFARFAIRVIPGFEGDFAWPPAECEALYQPELRGRTAGGRIRVGPAEPPAGVVSLLGPAAAVDEAVGEAVARLAELEQEAAATLDGEFPDSPDPSHMEAVRLLARLRGMPSSRAWLWMEEDAPRRISKLIIHPYVLREWVRRLPAGSLVRRLSGARLTDFLAAVDPDRSHLRRLATAAGTSEIREHARTADLPSGTVDERRLFALVLLASGTAPDARKDALERLAWIERTVRAEDVPPDVAAAARRERWEDGGGAWMRGIAAARESRWPAGEPARDLGIPEGLGARLAKSFESWLAAFELCEAWSIRGSLDPLSSTMASLRWGATGAAEPEEFTMLRNRCLAMAVDLANREIERLDRPGAAKRESVARLVALLPDSDSREPLVLKAVEFVESKMNPHPERLELIREFVNAAPVPVRSEALTALLLGLLPEGDPDLQDAILHRLEPRLRHAVPAALLVSILRERPESARVLDELVRRDADWISRLDPEKILAGNARNRPLWLRTLREEHFARLPLLLMLDLAAGPAPGVPGEKIRSIHRLLESGNWPAAEFAAAAAETLSPPARGLALRTLEALGPVPVPWREEDPASDFYRILWEARRGSAEAAGEVRRMLAMERGRNLPEGSLGLASWALSPHAILEDLLDDAPAGLHPPSVDGEALARILRGLSPERLATLLSQGRIRGLLKHVPAGALARTVDWAVRHSDPDAPTVQTILGRAEASSLLAALLPQAGRLEPELVKAVLKARSADGEFLTGLCIPLLDHQDPDVRTSARRTLRTWTGSPTAWLASSAGDPPPSEADLLRGLRRYGPRLAQSLEPAIRDQARLLVLERGAAW